VQTILKAKSIQETQAKAAGYANSVVPKVMMMMMVMMIMMMMMMMIMIMMMMMMNIRGAQGERHCLKL
jgi:hypothetical protein